MSVPDAPTPGVVQHAPRTCPVCGQTVTAAGTTDGSAGAPAVGDWTVCAYCLAWLVYLEDLHLRPVTNAEWVALSSEERVELTTIRERVRFAWSQPKPKEAS